MLAWACFVAVVIGWGSSFLGIRLALESFTPFGLVGLRNLAAAAVMLAIAILRREAPPRREDLPRLAFLGLLLVGASNLFTTLGQQYLSTGVGGLLNACISLWIVLLSAGEERHPHRVWVGMALGLAGVALLLLPGKAQRVSWLGFACMMASTFSFAWSALRLRKRPVAAGLPWVLAVQMGASGILLTGIASLQTGCFSGPLTGKALAALAYLVAVPSLVAYGAFAILSRLWSPGRFGIYAVLTPVVAVLLGLGFLRETLTPRMAAAMAIILAGVALVQIRPSAPAVAEEV
ncbi:MAG TPA: EamA family transporter [Holophagaceae bacterium]|nr:EamA family transporter [Holophagaceae bacterium]